MANKAQTRLNFVKGVYGDNWKRLRESEHKSVREFAPIVAMSYTSISKIENEINPPTIEQINAYQKHFNVSLDYLVGLTTTKDIELSPICDYTGLSEQAIEELHKIKIKDEEAQKQTGADTSRMDFLNQIISNGYLFTLSLYLELLQCYSKAMLESDDVNQQFDLNNKCDLTQLQISRLMNKIMDLFDEREKQTDRYTEIAQSIIKNNKDGE